MNIRPIPPAEAHLIMPLLNHVQTLHVQQQPERYCSDPDQREVLAWLKDWIAEDSTTALVAELDGDVVGYLIYGIEQYKTSPLIPDRNRAMLHHICVDPAHQRKGIAGRLIDQVRTHARTDGVTAIGVTYGTFNKASAKLMAKAGFKPMVVYAEGAV